MACMVASWDWLSSSADQSEGPIASMRDKCGIGEEKIDSGNAHQEGQLRTNSVRNTWPLPEEYLLHLTLTAC